MIETIIIAILVLIIILLTGFIYRCDDCGKLYGVKRINHQGCKRIVCKHCGKEK